MCPMLQRRRGLILIVALSIAFVVPGAAAQCDPFCIIKPPGGHGQSESTEDADSPGKASRHAPDHVERLLARLG